MTPEPKRVLILMSDTGGGHRAVAEAIREALKQRYGDAIIVDTVDVFRNYTPFPFKYAPEIYPWWVKNGRFVWRVSYRLLNRPHGTTVLVSIGAAIRRGLRRMLREHRADVVVCVHPLFVILAMNILRQQPTRPPFITVVTDLVSTHAFWYDRNVERILVPTQPAYDYGIKFGIQPERLSITGLPIRPQFTATLVSKPKARAHLNWDVDLPAILLVGGGDGMGPLFRIARRLNRLKGVNFQLAIVAGRNRLLKERLEAQHWQHPTHIYGFAGNMPELMAAADLMITKAGPTTISEGFIAGLPMILSSAIPGQEDGNVSYLVEHGAGVYAPTPRLVVKTVRAWLLAGSDFLRERGENSHQLAQPDAVWKVADEIWHYAQQTPIKNTPIRRSPVLRVRRKSWQS